MSREDIEAAFRDDPNHAFAYQVERLLKTAEELRRLATSTRAGMERSEIARRFENLGHRVENAASGATWFHGLAMGTADDDE